MTRTRLLAALVAGLTVAGIGTAAAATADDPATAPAAPVAVAASTTTATTSTTAPVPAGTGATSADDAGQIAVRHLGGGTVAEIEGEVEHGRAVWDVDVRRGAALTEVHVDRVTGTVTRVRDDRDGRGDSDGRGDRGREDGGRHGGDRHGSDDGPGHDLGDDRGGDR